MRDAGARGETGRRSGETRAGIDADEGIAPRNGVDARVGIRIETTTTTDGGFSVGVELLERRSDGE